MTSVDELMNSEDSDAGPETMDTDTVEPEPTPSSSGNQAPSPDTTAITTQPSSNHTQHLHQNPLGHYQYQDLGTADPRGSNPESLPAAQISSIQQQDQMNSLELSASATDEEMLKRTTNAGGPPEDQETDLYRSPEEIQNPAAAADVTGVIETSSSASKSSDTTRKKRQINLLRGNSVNEKKDTTNHDEPKPSAPPDVAKVYMKVDWPDEIPKRWKNNLQIALQTWCNSELKEKCSVNVGQLVGDERTAEVEITPSTALKNIKTGKLTFKQLDKCATVHFQDYEPPSVDTDSSPKMNKDVTDAEKNLTESLKDGRAASHSPENTDKPGASHPLTLPVFQYWYLSQAYRKELDLIENEFGVKINAETSVSFSAEKANEKRESDSVSRATQAFTALGQNAMKNLKYVSVPQTHMESDIMKETLRIIPNEQHKIMLSMSANNYLLSGPEQITSMVEKRLHLESTSFSYNKSHNMETDTKQWGTPENWSSTQTSQTLDMDIRDTQAPVAMDDAHWKLMMIAFEKQLCEIQNKYGVRFDVESVRGSIKVSARSRGTDQVNLETHALRALTHLYQKVVTSAVTCDLKDSSYTEKVSQAFQRIHSRHSCVGGGDRNGSWKLFGLPKHLIPAIAEIEKIVGHPVFDDKTKQMLGYPWDFPQASGFQRGQMGMDMIRGAHGTDLRVGKENFDFNQGIQNKAKENVKENEEDKCPICLDIFTQKRKVKCGHEFCKECLKQLIKISEEICPLCKKFALCVRPGASRTLTVPPFLFWYLSQAYRKELDRIENEFGVKINAETSVSFSAEKANEKRESDSVSRATQSFVALGQNAMKNLKSVSVPQTHMESDIMKETLRIIPNEQHKIMLSMSANNYLLSGPEQITSMVEKRLNLEPTSFSYNKSHNMETDTKQWGTPGNWSSTQTSQTLDMDIRDTQAPVAMDDAHWKLMMIAFEKQLCEIQNKYGVRFDVESVRGSIKVSARSRGTDQVNLETHALRALTHLYQKVVTSAVTCDLKDSSYTEKVSQAFERIRSRHSCVGGGDRNGSWKLFGLPKHLIPAIADIEKIVGHPVFDDKTKQMLGYPWDFPQASGFQRGQMGMDVMRGAHGTDWKDGPEAQSFNQDSSKEGKEDAKKKGSDKSEEDKCPICLDTFTQKTKLKCGHEFCKECLEHSIKSGGKICPVCKKIFGTLKGNQPDGTMEFYYRTYSLSGFHGYGTIEISYRIPGGTQTKEHPNPGKRYHGTQRTAYLPDNAEGNHVLKLLRRAFDQKLIFTVGTSRTTGADDAVTWNDIHHKTNTHGGPENFGYPDHDYLNRVKEELKAKGIE